MENSIRLDHTATWNEVCSATSFLFHGALEPGRSCELDCESTPELGDPFRAIAEKLAWLALASEAQDPICN